MSKVGTRGVDERTGGKTEGKAPEASDGGIDGETVEFLCKDC